MFKDLNVRVRSRSRDEGALTRRPSHILRVHNAPCAVSPLARQIEALRLGPSKVDTSRDEFAGSADGGLAMMGRAEEGLVRADSMWLCCVDSVCERSNERRTAVYMLSSTYRPKRSEIVK